jgi:hypothetical protein
MLLGTRLEAFAVEHNEADYVANEAEAEKRRTAVFVELVREFDQLRCLLFMVGEEGCSCCAAQFVNSRCFGHRDQTSVLCIACCWFYTYAAVKNKTT